MDLKVVLILLKSKVTFKVKPPQKEKNFEIEKTEKIGLAADSTNYKKVFSNQDLGYSLVRFTIFRDQSSFVCTFSRKYSCYFYHVKYQDLEDNN